MDISQIDLLTAAAAMLGVAMCGTTSIRTFVLGLAAQTALLAIITIMLAMQLHAAHYYWLGGVVLVVKAIAIPAYLSWAARKLQILRGAGPIIHPVFALLLGCSILIVSLLLAPRIAATGLGNTGAAGMALAMLLMGMVMMLTRRFALSQLIGFLVLENGIFLYGITQTHGMPIMVEMGVVFDLLVAVMIAGVVIFRLNRSFEHIDVTQLRGLRH